MAFEIPRLYYNPSKQHRGVIFHLILLPHSLSPPRGVGGARTALRDGRPLLAVQAIARVKNGAVQRPDGGHVTGGVGKALAGRRALAPNSIIYLLCTQTATNIKRKRSRTHIKLNLVWSLPGDSKLAPLIGGEVLFGQIVHAGRVGQATIHFEGSLNIPNIVQAYLFGVLVLVCSPFYIKQTAITGVCSRSNPKLVKQSLTVTMTAKHEFRDPFVFHDAPQSGVKNPLTEDLQVKDFHNVFAGRIQRGVFRKGQKGRGTSAGELDSLQVEADGLNCAIVDLTNQGVELRLSFRLGVNELVLQIARKHFHVGDCDFTLKV